MGTAMLILFIIFLSLVFVGVLRALARIVDKLNVMERRDDDYTFDESAMVEMIIAAMDDVQDIMDRNGTVLDRDLDLWSQPYNILLLKELLYDMFGMGDHAFDHLRGECIKRNYPITQTYATMRNVRNLKDPSSMPN